MKTPKRESNLSMFDLFADPELAGAKCARWKRKSRTAQIKRAIARLTAKNGQQTDLTLTGGQQDCDAQNAENAKQENLACTDAEQLTERKEKE